MLERTMTTFLLRHVYAVERQVKQDLKYSGRVSDLIHSREHYEAARQVFFRDLLWSAYQDYTPVVAAGIIRTSIELKLREAVAVKAFVRASPPLARDRLRLKMVYHLRHVPFLSALLRGSGAVGARRYISVTEILASWHALKMRSPVSPGQLKRFYGWANLVIHGGHRASIPEIWFALEYLRPVLRGSAFGGYTYTANPIVTDATAPEQVAALREHLQLRSEWRALVER
jgi:hypothetical protein